MRVERDTIFKKTSEVEIKAESDPKPNINTEVSDVFHYLYESEFEAS